VNYDTVAAPATGLPPCHHREPAESPFLPGQWSTALTNGV